MNDKFLHIINSLNDQYPPADIPEDIAWKEMRKLLDEQDDDTVLPPPPPSMPPNGNSYWKYGLLLLIILITGIAVYVTSNKTQPVQTVRDEKNTATKKVTEQNKDIAQSLESNDSFEKNNTNNPVDTIVTDRQTNKTTKSDLVIEKKIPSVDKNNFPLPAEHLIANKNNHSIRPHAKVKTISGDIDENNNGIAAAEINGINKNTINTKKITGKRVVVNSPSTNSKTPKAVNKIDQNIAESNTNNGVEKNTDSLNSTPTIKDAIEVLHDSSTIKNLDSLKKQLADTNKAEKININL